MMVDEDDPHLHVVHLLSSSALSALPQKLTSATALPLIPPSFTFILKSEINSPTGPFAVLPIMAPSCNIEDRAG